ncbi:MAG: hypothetical protein IKX65_05535 [Prevotella sp.]|nr:hypothetical protein [Prevotella sp.]
MKDEKALREKAEKYLVCMNEKCPQHEHCLRWQVGQYVSDKQLIITCVNPRNREMTDGKCPFYKDDQPQRVAIGMVHFFDEMPHKMELAIKSALIEHFTRTAFYKMRRGDRQITPENIRVIKQICRQHDWQEEPVFDSYSKETVW